MASAPRSVLREGIIAGLIGAAVVAIWFFAYDVARGHSFFTPGLLGAFVFYGVNTPIGVEPALGPILGYTVLHGLAFIAFGIVAATMMAMSEREPALFIAFVILFACFEVFFFGAIVIVASWVLDELAGWTIFVGNILAAVAMLAYYFTSHRTLARRLTQAWVEED